MPVRHRLLWVNFCSMFYGTLLSMLNERGPPAVQLTSEEGGEEGTVAAAEGLASLRVDLNINLR